MILEEIKQNQPVASKPFLSKKSNDDFAEADVFLSSLNSPIVPHDDLLKVSKSSVQRGNVVKVQMKLNDSLLNLMEFCTSNVVSIRHLPETNECLIAFLKDEEAQEAFVQFINSERECEIWPHKLSSFPYEPIYGMLILHICNNVLHNRSTRKASTDRFGFQCRIPKINVKSLQIFTTCTCQNSKRLGSVMSCTSCH